MSAIIPDSFIGRIQQLPVQMIATKARVTINQKTGTIIMTGDVEISPVVISHNGLSISTVMPPPQATPRNPIVTDHEAIAISTGMNPTATCRTWSLRWKS